MKSSLKNMVLVLFSITFISAACVGAVYIITEEPIKLAEEAAVTAAVAEVLPEFDSTKTDTYKDVDGLDIIVHTATKEDKVVGYAVESATKSGFSGLIRMMVGFDTHGKILNVNILKHAETPGLGSKMTLDDLHKEKPKNKVLASIKGKMASKTKLTVKKDGGDIDALTAATITSRAYAEAVARAYAVFKVAAGWEKEVHATTGATNTSDEWDDEDKKEE